MVQFDWLGGCGRLTVRKCDTDLLNVQVTAVVPKSALISETPAQNRLKVGETFCFV
jgi:hypothetical protein